ncbi:alpha/beta fold hydrolase [Micromonospora sp. NPDC005172]|uniref:alpha/beta fold hydrolase n=1 Tax=Micromonospora sp. NPDC005172 TaxID=3156867 RepID=UPI0033A61D6F
MFDGFEEFDIATSGTTIHGRRGGDGPPVLLLHGIPETHLMWHRVAPRLAEHFTVVTTDLRSTRVPPLHASRALPGLRSAPGRRFARVLPLHASFALLQPRRHRKATSVSSAEAEQRTYHPTHA